MRVLLVGLLVGCMGCASVPVREYDYCRATSVNSVTDATGVGEWTVQCVNQWDLRQPIIFDREVKDGDEVYYIPYKENEGGELHGYVKSVQRKP